MPILHWLTREHDLHLSGKAPYRLLEHVETYGDENNENMLIQGDNLDALKALLPYYAGKVKCIYIDPPFNTKNTFEHYDDNLEHSLWLAMIYPRLEFLHNLLSEDGTIFIHIDDNELAYLLVIADEIMGRKNRVSIVTFKQGAATGHKAINKGIVTTSNFLLIYAKNKETWKPNKVFTRKESRDTRYTQYILDFEQGYVHWKFCTLKKAFSQFLNIPEKELKKVLAEQYEEKLSQFVIDNAARVTRTARPDINAVGEGAKRMIKQSLQERNKIHLLERENHPNMYFYNGERIIFYKDKLKEIDGLYIAGEPLTSIWDDLLSNNLHNEGGMTFPKNKKPEALIKRCIELSTNIGDTVLDSFLGSGTTSAVAHKMGRKYIGVELGEHCRTHCKPRLEKVVNGDSGGISKALDWQGGGGFRFYKLGDPIFEDDGSIRDGISFAHLAAHIWFAETGVPMQEKASTPCLGIHDGTAYYLLYNGILKDRSVNGGNVLTKALLQKLQVSVGKKIIYGERSLLSPQRLKEMDIEFKQTPYDIKGR